MYYIKKTLGKDGTYYYYESSSTNAKERISWNKIDKTYFNSLLEGAIEEATKIEYNKSGDIVYMEYPNDKDFKRANKNFNRLLKTKDIEYFNKDSIQTRIVDPEKAPWLLDPVAFEKEKQKRLRKEFGCLPLFVLITVIIISLIIKA